MAEVLTIFMVCSQFLTQEEFEKIRVKQLSAAITPSKGRKRQLEEMLKEQEERRQEGGELLSEAAINIVPHAKRKRTKEERVASVKVSAGYEELVWKLFWYSIT